MTFKLFIVIEATDDVKDGVSRISEGRRNTFIDADDDSPNKDHHDDHHDAEDGEKDQAHGSQLIAQSVEALGMEKDAGIHLQYV